METKHKEEYTYTLHSLGGAPCILAQTECTFLLDYRTLQYGVQVSTWSCLCIPQVSAPINDHASDTQTVKIILPKNPEISGSCVRKGDTAVLTMHWSVFNFSLVFTENPEGNSYYLNKAILKYNQVWVFDYDFVNTTQLYGYVRTAVSGRLLGRNLSWCRDLGDLPLA